jgi:adenylate cyclase
MKYKALLVLISTLIFVVWGMVSFGLFSGIERVLTDRLFTGKPVDERIEVVGIDNKSLEVLGQWPLPRALIAEGLEKIIEAGPAGIGIDILFADPSRLGSDDDAALEKVLRESAVPITLPIEALALSVKGEATPRATETLSTLPQFLGNSTNLGHINLIKDRDGIVRRVPLTILDGESVIPGFSAQVVERTGGNDAIEHIVWSGKPGTVRHISFSDVIEGKVNPDDLKGAYVFLGATATDLHDEQTTPTSAGTAMAGVEIQAQIGNMLLMGYSLTPISPLIFAFWLLIISLIPIFLFFYARSIVTAIVLSSTLFATNLVAVVILFEQGIAVGLVHTSLAILLSAISAFSVRYFILERERREIRGVFSKYVSGAVLEELLKNPSAVKLGGSEAEVTVFFSDIRGFTTLSEKLTPRELTELLNHYLTRMTDVILNDKGVVDKYIGDAIMAFWGAPLHDPHHAYHAVQSSLTMLEALDDFNKKNVEEGHSVINIGIGLNTGKVIIGNMGSTQRFDYTIMGDAVNLGSRIEGQTKTYGVRLLASEMTMCALERTGHTKEFLAREIDKVTVKGKKEPVALFEIVERSKEEGVRKIMSDFETLRREYYAGNWKEASVLGTQILKSVDDGPTKVLLERAQEFLSNPPESWNGVYELTSK